jgi:RNA methyltransferase
MGAVLRRRLQAEHAPGFPAVRCVEDFGDVAAHEVQEYDVAVVLFPEGLPLLRVVGEAFAGGRRALNVLVVAGPEGGLTDADEEALIAGGCVRGALGPDILSVETAVVAAHHTGSTQGAGLDCSFKDIPHSNWVLSEAFKVLKRSP